ncbi:mannose-1-phosphate guanyltransferase [Acetivibrio mesophilus]|uniref:Nucleotidyltransferase n=1 Tax=Acetivibrio mesophilus TaxID=2487273 RepID=A0A4Q0I267_9FIRM|nr:mannose-1-phosphate guanyltransferase [Acetivibrio mesophilus]ODM26683.1 nucleotidyltransferase [Clostridium sp. Bc-iso-3]RXE58293.1 nucleotidyltransferase [Acetivibrio mesophilus]HHV28429.1 NTP transferase domain-containing protein [Clostridium sp.]
MKAIIMAGGEGSRLRPLTCDLPKPMVPIMNIPIMEHIINLLKKHGITKIGVTLMYLPQKIKDYFGNGSNFGVNISYFTEDTPLGTAGSVKNAEDFLDESFIVISGDSLTNMDITKAIEFHKMKNSKATLVLTRVDVPLEYGVVITDKYGSITGFLEKPSWGEVFSDTVNTGTYILEPEVLKYLEKGKKVDFSQDLFPHLLLKKEPMYGYVMDDYWCDIGDLQAYLQAHYDVLEGKIQLDINATEIKKGVWVGAGSTIDPDAIINPPCVIGDNCRIESGAVIDSLSVIGDNNVIERESSIKRSVIWNGSFIEYGSEIRGAILCNKTNLKRYVHIFENAIVGDNCLINERVVIKPNVKIWPQKSVDPFAIVDRNIIWGSKHSKSIFGENGLSGIINVDISPEFATRLGAAYGSIFKKGSKVVVSSTTSNSARMFKHAFISGILSVGVEVFNLSSLLTPLSRHAINFLSVEGGIHIKLSEDNPNKLKVDFMDSKGASISRVTERKIENSFSREDFKRCSGDEVSRLNNITDFKNYYVRSILNEVDVESIKSNTPKICIVSPSDFVISIVVPMLTDLGCKVASFSSSNLNEVDTIIDEIKNNNAGFAAFIDSNGETLVLIDKYGNVVKDDLFLCLTSLITFKSVPNSKVVVPITAPSIIETLAGRYNGKVVRTKTSPQAVMEQMLNHNLFKNRENMDQFLLNFDAIAGLVKIIEYLCLKNTTLTETIKEIPDFYVSKKKIFCPWELKGRVMRTLITEKDEEKVELLDGVKFILDNGWALVLPDADMPLCRVYSEGISPDVAETISDKYLDKIKAIINDKK